MSKPKQRVTKGEVKPEPAENSEESGHVECAPDLSFMADGIEEEEGESDMPVECTPEISYMGPGDYMQGEMGGMEEEQHSLPQPINVSGPGLATNSFLIV